ncbi:MAG: RNA polymerase sporulation sigma factor SigK [Oscillospiraceae bacterium]|jgi:RNA polymerase sporulation-specific sigma factor|nr:RNA polymerase sporulation sigma factor SigK [Oscillospiraceae bacterium]
MFSALISAALANLLWLALHIEGNGSFPKPLTPAQERDCFARKEQGDPSARSQLIEHNLRLVAHIAKKYYSATNDQDDLISIGTIGLIKAVNTFSYEKGARFATYAARCIENEILMHFRNVKKTAGDVYISDPLESSDSEGGTLTLMDLFSGEDSLIDNLDLKMKAERLYRYIAENLDSREREIVELRYGLGGRRPLTQREIAKKLEISRSYVSRIEKKALGKLRERFDRV